MATGSCGGQRQLCQREFLSHQSQARVQMPLPAEPSLIFLSMSVARALFGIYFCYKVGGGRLKLQFHWMFLFSLLTTILQGKALSHCLPCSVYSLQVTVLTKPNAWMGGFLQFFTPLFSQRIYFKHQWGPRKTTVVQRRRQSP